MKKSTIAFFLLVIIAIHVGSTFAEQDDGYFNAQDQCGKNRVLSGCTSRCPPRCKHDGILCPAVCGPPGCVCAPGYKLDDNDECVIC